MAFVGVLLAGIAALLSACPLAHDEYDTGRACVRDQDCPSDEVCATPDAAVSDDGGVKAESLCYPRSGLIPCFPSDAGVPAYYCFGVDQICVREPSVCLEYADAGCDSDAGCDGGSMVDAGCVRWKPERFGCTAAGRTQ